MHSSTWLACWVLPAAIPWFHDITSGGGGHFDCLRHASSEAAGFVRAAAQTNRRLLNALLAHNLRSREVCLPGLDFWRGRRNALPILRSPPCPPIVLITMHLLGAV